MTTETGGMLKMSELAERSGVSAATIKHYLREGLLGTDDEVVRTSRNMAYYPLEFVERVRLIKRLQEERYMPLRVIRELIGSDPDRAARMIELEDRILEQAIEARETGRVSRARIRETYEVPQNVLDRLEELGVLTPTARGYDADDVAIIEAISRFRAGGYEQAIGFTVYDTLRYREALEPLVEEEVRVLLDVLPESNRKPYDMYDVIRRIVDDGTYFDIKPQFAKTLITCLARFGGRAAGIVANQPKQLGGILDNDSSDKAARFINLCNAFNIPLVYLMDVPGFMVGTKVEEGGIIRHGAKMLYATANATVPKVTVVLRKAYGAGYYVMNGRAFEPDLIVAWPSAEISVMGAEGAVEIIFRKQVEAAEDPAATKQELIENFRKIIDVYIAAGNDMIDDVIDPRETRATICRALEMAGRKHVERPWKRSGVVPV
jgi:DNA-binding transcriptional MerR regulator